MKGDFTRRTFDRKDHYRAVLMQQGRVQLDADWNEQQDIQAYVDETSTTDVIGRHGGPIGDDGGFHIFNGGSFDDGDEEFVNVYISQGRYYVDGILLENDDTIGIEEQPDYGDPLEGLSEDGRYVAYLDVWREHLTAVEVPDLREVALGGPDHATRSRTVWQVKLEKVDDESTCVDFDPGWWRPDNTPTTAYLRARAQAPEESPDPCVIPATAGYRRLENQLYRVEIHSGTDPDAESDVMTYKWSRDNGTVVARLVGIVDGPPMKLEIDAPGRDEKLGFSKDQWVEVISLEMSRAGVPGYLARIEDVQGTLLEVAEWAGDVPAMEDLGEVTVVRRWDSAGAVSVAEGEWVDLEDGVQIQFSEQGDGPAQIYRTGDYWLIPARTANLQREDVDPDLAGNVEWPVEDGSPVFRRPHGIERHYAAIALLDRVTEGGEGETETYWHVVSDCRRLFPPLTELTDMEYAGGDGQEAMPGDPLPLPLQVSVSNGIWPVEGARVRFSAPIGETLLSTSEPNPPDGSPSSVVAVTDEFGIAQCYWKPVPNVAAPSQEVWAELLRPDDQTVGASVRFGANLSIASRVWYDPGSCQALQGVRTVQETIDRLVRTWSLAPVGGDGQDGNPGADLPFPVEVLVRSDCGPVPNAIVRCTVRSGAVAATAADLDRGLNAVNIATDGTGVGRCFWRLGPQEPVQTLSAELVPPERTPVEGPTRLTFTANLRSAARAPGMHVRDVILLVEDASLGNDSTITADRLAEGFAVELDDEPDPVLVDEKPVLTLTVSYPIFVSDGERSRLGGHIPFVVRGRAAARGPRIDWSPGVSMQGFLDQLFGFLRSGEEEERLLCEIRLTGRAVRDAATHRLLVNGFAPVVRSRDGSSEIELPSVDDVHGADFVLWFWVVPQQVDIVTTSEGRLRMKSARDAISSAMPRSSFHAALPAEFGAVAPPADAPEPDLEAARRSADRAFRGIEGERSLVIVADSRFASAAGVLASALSAIDVNVEIVEAEDPVEVARSRLAAGSPVDGVLTEHTVASTLAEEAGFGNAFRL